MLLLSAAQSKELDRMAIEGLGIAEEALMEAAGTRVAEAMERELGSMAGRQVALLCGKGRNGGDGMVVARHLLNDGAGVVVLIAAKPGELSAPAEKQAAILSKLGLRLIYVEGEKELKLAEAVFRTAEICVDALYGTGFHGAVTALPAALLIAMNSAGRPVVSVDLPSGVDADTGEVRGAAAYAALTVTFSFPKRGLTQQPARAYTGKLVVADIGIPLSLASGLQGLAEIPEAGVLRTLFPGRDPQAHKKNSSLLLVAGSGEYPGAAILAARAALAAGAGYLRVLTPLEVVAQIQSAVPEAVVSALSPSVALKESESAHAVVLGPGLGRSAGALSLAAELYESAACPLLCDADALFAIAGAGLKPKGPRLLTPHEGEAARLLGGALGNDRFEAASRLALNLGVVALLKGPGSVVAEPGGALSVNSSGSQMLASAGTGDVLAGVCGALMAAGLGPWDAARLGAWWHGAACDARQALRGAVGLSAGELIDYLPSVFSTSGGKA